MQLPRKKYSQKGLSLIEILISVAIVALLSVLAVVFLRMQVSRSRDAQRKSDLERIQVAFEEYYNDNGCYPPVEILQNCGGPELQPYLQLIPCDPLTNEPYLYAPHSADICKGYRLLTQLEDANDPGVAELKCDGPNECGFGSGYNYGVSSGLPVATDEGYVPPPSPSPTPSPSLVPSPSASPVSSPNPSPSGTPAPSPQAYACFEGYCNSYEDPVDSGCPMVFYYPNVSCLDQQGNFACGSPQNPQNSCLK